MSEAKITIRMAEIIKLKTGRKTYHQWIFISNNDKEVALPENMMVKEQFDWIKQGLTKDYGIPQPEIIEDINASTFTTYLTWTIKI